MTARKKKLDSAVEIARFLSLLEGEKGVSGITAADLRTFLDLASRVDIDDPFAG